MIFVLFAGLAGYIAVQVTEFPGDALREGDTALIKCTAIGIEPGNQFEVSIQTHTALVAK